MLSLWWRTVRTDFALLSLTIPAFSTSYLVAVGDPSGSLSHSSGPPSGILPLPLGQSMAQLCRARRASFHRLSPQRRQGFASFLRRPRLRLTSLSSPRRRRLASSSQIFHPEPAAFSWNTGATSTMCLWDFRLRFSNYPGPFAGLKAQRKRRLQITLSMSPILTVAATK